MEMVNYQKCHRAAGYARVKGVGVATAIFMLCLFTSSLICAKTALACDTLEECLADVEVTASAGTGNGIDKEEEALAEEVLKYGDKAVPMLIGYLEHPNERVRNLAGYILTGSCSSTITIDKKYLPQLIKAYKKDGGWLPGAIASTGTDEAARFLVAEFMKEREYNTQFPGAITMLGEKAVPYLLKEYECDGRCDDKHLGFIGRVFGEMGERAQGVVPVMTNIAVDTNRDIVVRKEAIFALGQMKGTATEGIPALKYLASGNDKDIAASARESLVQIGGEEAIKILIEKINSMKEEDDVIDYFATFSDIAMNGQAAINAGEPLTSKLGYKVRAVRILAARTIGFIGYQNAAPKLIDKLGSVDWLEVLVSAESLGRLKAGNALNKLEEVRVSFWYPPVREAAGKAIRVIRGEDRYASPETGQQFYFKFIPFFGWSYKYKDECKLQEYPLAKRDPNKYYARENKVLLEGMVYKTDDYIQEPMGDGWYKSVKKEKSKNTTATVALKVDNGWILGRDYGEFGGELVLWESEKDNEFLIDINVGEIFQTNNGIFAIGGIPLRGDDGIIFKLEKNDGKWKALPYRYFPKGALKAQMLADGRILINTFSAGTILFSPSTGQFEMAECADK